jgi:predicted nucleotidyltransferase
MKIQKLCRDILSYKYHRGHLRRRITKADVDAARAWAKDADVALNAQTDVESEATAPADEGLRENLDGSRL